MFEEWIMEISTSKYFFFILFCILFLKMLHMHITMWKHSLFEMSMAAFFVG